MKEAQNFAEAGMLIRKSIEDVFEALVDPEITTQFWFTRSTGRLDREKTVEWTWDMYALTVPVRVTALEYPTRLVMEWGEPGDLSTVEWTLRSIAAKGTFISVVNSGFKGSADEILGMVRNSTEGFALVLAGMKAWLEHEVKLNLVVDRHPERIGN
jgi:uncharacterized protein YndB with AHSA1/START domain